MENEQSPDAYAYIRKSFREKNFFSVFLTALSSLILLLAILGGVLFHFRSKVFDYFAKQSLLSSEEPAVVDDGGAGTGTVTEKIIEKQSIFTQEYFIVDAVKKTNPAVVSITISRETSIGSGSGFLVSADGLIVTNRHVVEDVGATYTVFTNDGKKHTATVVARDPVLDIALMKIEGSGYTFLSLGNSDSLLPGQTVIAIGNALGEFKNTVSVGVISGLYRSLTAGGSGGRTELLDHVIQTDAAINPGNSGGPLLDLSGRVVGVNVAVYIGSQGLGFALPINSVKGAIDSVKATGKIVRPYLGVRYISINSEIKEANNLSVDYGVWVKPGKTAGEPAVIDVSPAAKAGIVEGDIILSVDGTKINETTSLATLIGQKKVGQVVTLKILRAGEEKNIKVTLEVFKED